MRFRAFSPISSTKAGLSSSRASASASAMTSPTGTITQSRRQPHYYRSSCISHDSRLARSLCFQTALASFSMCWKDKNVYYVVVQHRVENKSGTNDVWIPVDDLKDLWRRRVAFFDVPHE